MAREWDLRTEQIQECIMDGANLAPIVIAVGGILFIIVAAWRRKRKIHKDPKKYNELAVSYVSRCLRNGKPIEPQVVAYFLEPADPAWAQRVGYGDGGEAMREIETAQWRRSDPPRRYEVALPRELVESFTDHARRMKG